MDGVLVLQRSSWRIIHRELGTDNEDSFTAYMKGEIDDREFMRRDIGKWLSVNPGLDRSWMMNVYAGVERTPGLKEVFSELRRSGIDIVIISGGMDLLANELSRETVACPSLANGVEFDERGRPTGEGILRVPLRDKGSVLRDHVERGGYDGPVITVGDSIVDLTMFDISDLSIAFRPEDPSVSSGADISIREPDLRPVLNVIFSFLGKDFQ